MLDYVMNIAVCDDDPRDRQQIAEMTGIAAAAEGIACSLTCFESAAALLNAVEAGAAYHLLLLDVMMPETDGLRLAAALRKRQYRASIVFISANREMAMYGYEVGAARYLAKPPDAARLREALSFCYRTELARQVFMLPTLRGLRKLSVDEIVYIESWGRGVRVVLRQGQEDCAIKISDMEKMLPDNRFVLCHRTLLVNLACVRYLRYCEMELDTGDTLPVSKYRQNATRDKLLRYLEDCR